MCLCLLLLNNGIKGRKSSILSSFFVNQSSNQLPLVASLVYTKFTEVYTQTFPFRSVDLAIGFSSTISSVLLPYFLPFYSPLYLLLPLLYFFTQATRSSELKLPHFSLSYSMCVCVCVFVCMCVLEVRRKSEKQFHSAAVFRGKKGYIFPVHKWILLYHFHSCVRQVC